MASADSRHKIKCSVAEFANTIKRTEKSAAQDRIEFRMIRVTARSINPLFQHPVRRIAVRSELDLRTLGAARVRLVAAVHNQVGVPLALAVCFVAGMMAVPRNTPPQGKAGTVRRAAGRVRHITRLIRTSALSATAYSALFQGRQGQHEPKPVH